MRLNPMGVKFLGPLPSESLVIFYRVIYPMVVWVTRQNRFFPNWEVEKVVRIPLRNLLNPENYARYRVNFQVPHEDGQNGDDPDFPCFFHKNQNEKEVLWGATYRIVTVFLELVFGFRTPDMSTLPVINGTLDESYYNGADV